MNTFCTYVHFRPDGTPFYVGKGRYGRAYQLRRSRNVFHQNIVNKYGESNIVVRLIKKGLSEVDAFAQEIIAIDCLKDFDYELTNATLGGEGNSGLKYISDELRAKLSALHKGNKYRLGLKDSEATRILKTAVLIGNKRRLGTKMPEWQKETKRLLMLSRNPMNSEEIRARHRERMNDPEVREKRSLAMKRAWQRRRGQ